jgi:hypothetical protein
MPKKHESEGTHIAPSAHKPVPIVVYTTQSRSHEFLLRHAAFIHSFLTLVDSRVSSMMLLTVDW